MPKKIPLSDMREWLKKYEDGQSEVSISAEAHRNIKTIKRGIEWAHTDRYMAAAQSDLLKEALRNHQKQLLNIINSIQSALVVPPTELIIYRQPAKGTSQAISPGVAVGYQENKGLTITLLYEDAPQWGLLKEHLKRDPLWPAINDWKQAMIGYLKAGRELAIKAEMLLEIETHYKVVREPTTPPFLDYNHTVGLLCQRVLNEKLDKEDEIDIERSITIDTSRGAVMYGVGNIMAECPEAEEDAKVNIIKAYKKLQGSREVKQVIETYQDVGESIKKVKQIAEEISLVGLIPGKCRVCKRLGIS